MKLIISAQYEISAESVVELPEGRTWKDVEFIEVKWDDVYILFEGESEYVIVPLEYPMEFDINSVDTKYPDNVYVYTTDPDRNLLI